MNNVQTSFLAFCNFQRALHKYEKGFSHTKRRHWDITSKNVTYVKFHLPLYHVYFLFNEKYELSHPIPTLSHAKSSAAQSDAIVVRANHVQRRLKSKTRKS